MDQSTSHANDQRVLPRDAANAADASAHSAPQLALEPRVLGDALLQAIGNTDICVFMYYPQEKRIEVPKNTCDKYGCHAEYRNMPASFADDFVYDEDRADFFELYRKIDEGAGTATARFHSKDLSACCRVTLTELRSSADGSQEFVGVVEGSAQVREVVGVIEDVSEWDRDLRLMRQIQDRLAAVDSDAAASSASDMVAAAISRQYYGLYCIDLQEDTYFCYEERLPNGPSAAGEGGPCTPALDDYLERFVDPRDREHFRMFVDPPSLADQLADQPILSCEYRRKGVGWTRGQFIVAERDADGRAISAVFAAVDINMEKAVDEQRRRAVFESQHDQLTGAFNRKAFDEVLVDGIYKNQPVGFLIMDIDRFKEINDEFGHEVGDKVIAGVARAIEASFREGDEVYRIGGDEFVVILPKAEQSGWKAICRKLERLHSDLVEILPEDIEVTLSSGACFSSSGVHPWMYRLADEALFNTKRNGRAGCTLMDRSGEVLDFWRDVDAVEKGIAILSGSNAALARIERTKKDVKPGRFLGGDAAKSIYGMPFDATPEECYEIWTRGIVPMYRPVVEEAAQKMLGAGNVECTFMWQREGGDPFFIRMVGAGRMEGETAIVYGIHRSLEGAQVVESDDRQHIIQAQNAASLATAYMDLTRNSFFLMKGTSFALEHKAPEDDAAEGVRRMVEYVVHPDCQEKMSAFLNLDTVPQRLEGESSIACEYQSVTGRGWCRASWLPVRRDDAGTVTHALLTVSTIDSAKQREMQKERETARLMALHYQAAETLLNTKVLAIALLEKESCAGSMWTSYSDFSRAEDAVMSELLERDAQNVPERIRADFLAALDPSLIVERVEEAGRYTVPTETVMPNGFKRYVEYHFTEYDRDPRLLLAVVEDVSAMHQQEGRSVEDLFDSVPGGLITYEWDGASLRTLHVSRYCNQLFGEGATDFVGHSEGPDFARVHPDDKEAYWQAASRALHDGSTEFHHVYRMWDPERERYVWSNIDAVVRPLADGHSLIYALYTDITDQKDAETLLVESFEERVESALHANEDSVHMGVFDLTEGTAIGFTDGIEGASMPLETLDYQLAQERVSLMIRGEADQKRFVELFAAENLLAQAVEGKTRVDMECLLESTPGMTEWCQLSAELVNNPLNGHVEAICSSTSVNSLRMSNLLVKLGMSSVYSMVAVLVDDGGEYYLYDQATGASCQHRIDFWTTCENLFRFLCSPEEAARVNRLLDRQAILAAVSHGGSPEIPLSIAYGGAPRRYCLRFAMLDKEKGLVVAALRDVTDEEMDAKFRHAARHDALTDLYNRQAYFDECRRLLDEHPEEDFAMLKLNVRRFRLFNASFGEKAGDDFLIAIANGLRALAPSYDLLAYGRIEGDVFSAFYPTSCKEMAERHIALIGKLFADYSDDFLLEPSVGIYPIADRKMSLESMFARATMAARAGYGKADFTGYYTAEMERRFEDEILIANEMRVALDKRQFAVYLQPKYDLLTGKRSGAEALVRWEHPVRGTIMPGVFIPVFESNGFVVSFDRYMWESVCMLLRRWVDEGRQVLPVSVNMSRVSAYSPMTVPYLKELVERYGIEPRLLQLELTESAYIDDPEDIKRSLRELQRYGFTILMDDFGSGYSSLNTLRELPVDALKLDMRFLSDACVDPRGRAVIQSTVEMTKRLGLPVVAEGVETSEQAEFLQSVGCEFAQGYLYAKPMPVKEYELLD